MNQLPLPGARERDRAAIADLCRLSDQDRSKTVATLRRACRAIEEEDIRYGCASTPPHAGAPGCGTSWSAGRGMSRGPVSLRCWPVR